MLVMNGGQLPTSQLHDINWGALDYVYVYVYVCEREREGGSMTISIKYSILYYYFIEEN